MARSTAGPATPAATPRETKTPVPTIEPRPSITAPKTPSSRLRRSGTLAGRLRVQHRLAVPRHDRVQGALQAQRPHGLVEDLDLDRPRVAGGVGAAAQPPQVRSEEHTSELQSREN